MEEGSLSMVRCSNRKTCARDAMMQRQNDLTCILIRFFGADASKLEGTKVLSVMKDYWLKFLRLFASWKLAKADVNGE